MDVLFVQTAIVAALAGICLHAVTHTHDDQNQLATLQTVLNKDQLFLNMLPTHSHEYGRARSASQAAAQQRDRQNNQYENIQFFKNTDARATFSITDGLKGPFKQA